MIQEFYWISFGTNRGGVGSWEGTDIDGPHCLRRETVPRSIYKLAVGQWLERPLINMVLRLVFPHVIYDAGDSFSLTLEDEL